MTLALEGEGRLSRKKRMQQVHPFLFLPDLVAAPVKSVVESGRAVLVAHILCVTCSISCSAPRQLDGESIRNYRIRLLQPYKANSLEYAGVGDDILKALPPEVFGIAETKIYADSIAAARNPNVPAGELWPVYETDATGRRMTTWRGQPRVWLEQFSCRPRRVIGIRNHTRYTSSNAT